MARELWDSLQFLVGVKIGGIGGTPVSPRSRTWGGALPLHLGVALVATWSMVSARHYAPLTA